MSDPTKTRPTQLGAALLALLVTVLWSSSWILIRWGLDDEGLEPVTFAALRYGLAAVVLVGWVGSRRSLRADLRRVDRRSLLAIAALGVVFYAITQGAQFVAIDQQPVATTSLVLSLSPALLALGGSKSIAEASTPRQILGSLLVAGGAWVYFAGDLGATAAGMVAALVALLANVTAALQGRHINRDTHLSPAVVTALSMGVGAVLLVAAGLITEGVPSLSGRAIAIVIWLAVVNTAIAFTMWNRALRSLSALEAVAINNTMLVQIAFLGWVFLDETLGWGEIAGIVLVSVGVLAAQRTLERRGSSSSVRRGGGDDQTTRSTKAAVTE